MIDYDVKERILSYICNPEEYGLANLQQVVGDLKLLCKNITPCDVCNYGSPSSGDGRPCTVCPAYRELISGLSWLGNRHEQHKPQNFQCGFELEEHSHEQSR